MNERTRDQLDRMSPEKRAKVEAAMAKFRTPEYRAKEMANREAYDREFAETGTIATVSTPMNVAELAIGLKAAREAAKMTVAEIAEISGIDQSAIFKLERGENPNPTIGTLNRYAAAFGGQILLIVKGRTTEGVR